MKLKINGVQIEGDTNEVATLLRSMQTTYIPTPQTGQLGTGLVERPAPVKNKKIKRRLISSGKQWTKREVEVMFDNALKTPSELKKLLPGRSRHTLYQVNWAVRKILDGGTPEKFSSIKKSLFDMVNEIRQEKMARHNEQEMRDRISQNPVFSKVSYL